ncbi:MAG TPA: dihydrofolate reductase [Bacteriovoracaceae bacterium]|nr:dihydrofolate reductase [Bacteriovoracaceae bacterium]
MEVKFIAIAAIGKNRQIGLAGKLPWSIPQEYDHFKQTVWGQYVLIGRKNFELHGQDVKGSKAIVLTRDKEYKSDKAVVCHSMEEVVAFADQSKIALIYVIGGAEIYNLTLPYLSEFICSEIDYDGPADTYFPEMTNFQWEEKILSHHPGWVKKLFIRLIGP